MKRKADQREDARHQRPASLQTAPVITKSRPLSLQTRSVRGPAIRSPEKPQRRRNNDPDKQHLSIKAKKKAVEEVNEAKDDCGVDFFTNGSLYADEDGAGGQLDAAVPQAVDDPMEEEELLEEQEGDGETFEDACELYAGAVLANSVGFYRVGETLWVVEGWDRVKATGTDRWFHLTVQEIQGVLAMGCRCGRCRAGNAQCLHKWYAETHRERFPSQPWKDIKNAAIMVTRETLGVELWKNVFTVGLDYEASRAIVVHTGQDSGAGLWSCSKRCSKATRCMHIVRARIQLQRLIAGDSTTTEQGSDDVPVDAEEEVEMRSSASHLPVRPPEWAALPGDSKLYLYPAPVRNSPGLLCLDKNSSCPCHEKRVMYKEGMSVFRQPCVVYTLVGAFDATVEVAECPQCTGKRRRNIGPDLREMGLFNFNNHSMFSHELLEDFVNAFTASETPFFAWVTMMERRYITSARPFVGYKTFVTAWFGYAELLAFEGDMTCAACGSHPDALVCDGVTSAFPEKHRLKSLEPPTKVRPGCELRGLVKAQPKVQFFIEKTFRVALRGAVEPAKENAGDALKAANSQRIVEVYQRLLTCAPAVAAMFKEVVVDGDIGAVEDSDLKKARERRRISNEFFLNLVAEESVMQMIPRPAFVCLSKFNSNPTRLNASGLVGIPTFFALLEWEWNNLHQYTDVTRKVGLWMAQEAVKVLQKLLVHKGPPKMWEPGRVEPPWQVSGCCYSMPQIRDRPEYPGLLWDRKRKAKNERNGDGCSKFYGRYGEATLTGGLMVFWCTHSICYGFHCIPEAEGRDDVFSALITRWPKAPKQVIYDYACALGPYCMLREPDFFADTQFLVDGFHSQGHTKCSTASMIKTYSKVDPRLAMVNSSAAECGNGVLGRVRKSLSYMSQRRAVIFTKVFMCVTNRIRMRRMEVRRRKV
ncbi:hypothetical protein C8J56DRAFT_1047478 [Mycena floridula]|nr:hypothetical protein C8J56DRAFT_1047478 [Mycena floridula]